MAKYNLQLKAKATNFVWLHFWKLSCLLQKAKLHIHCQYWTVRIRGFGLHTSVVVRIGRVIPESSSMQRCESRMRPWRLLRSGTTDGGQWCGEPSPRQAKCKNRTPT